MNKDAKSPKTSELQQVAVPDVTNFSGEAERLISQAIDKNVPVEALERLLAMRRELKEEKAREVFNRSMKKFQGECPIIGKNSTAGNNNYGYKYATIDHIAAIIKPLLEDNGFSYTFNTKKTEHSLITYCVVTHEEGYEKISEFEMAIDKNARMNDSQKDGSANSYGKRYALCNAFGIIIGGEDTDANYNKPSIKQQLTLPPAEKLEVRTSTLVIQPEDTITQEQKSEILDIVYRTGRSRLELDSFLNEAFNGKTLETLSKEQAYKVIGRLQKEGKKTVSEPRVTEDDLNEMARAIQ